LETRGSTHSLQQFYQTHKKRTLKVLRYYDAALAAKRISMPIHCACARFDPHVAPPAQFAVYNALAGTKELFVLMAGHHEYPEQKQQERELIIELDAFFAPLSD
jgi:cephalosporin-C deacetylase